MVFATCRRRRRLLVLVVTNAKAADAGLRLHALLVADIAANRGPLIGGGLQAPRIALSLRRSACDRYCAECRGRQQSRNHAGANGAAQNRPHLYLPVLSLCVANPALADYSKKKTHDRSKTKT